MVTDNLRTACLICKSLICKSTWSNHLSDHKNSHSNEVLIYISSDLVVSTQTLLQRGKEGLVNIVQPSHYGLAVAMDSAKSEAFEVSCWASVNWSVLSRCVKCDE